MMTELHLHTFHTSAAADSVTETGDTRSSGPRSRTLRQFTWLLMDTSALTESEPVTISLSDDHLPSLVLQKWFLIIFFIFIFSQGLFRSNLFAQGGRLVCFFFLLLSTKVS